MAPFNLLTKLKSTIWLRLVLPTAMILLRSSYFGSTARLAGAHVPIWSLNTIDSFSWLQLDEHVIVKRVAWVAEVIPVETSTLAIVDRPETRFLEKVPN